MEPQMSRARSRNSQRPPPMSPGHFNHPSISWTLFFFLIPDEIRDQDDFDTLDGGKWVEPLTHTSP